MENSYAKHKDKREHTSNKDKSKGKLDKEALKKAKIQALVFLASLSDIDVDSNDHESSLSDDECDKKITEQLNGLCYVVDSTHGGLCTMALSDEEIGKGKSPDDECASQVSLSPDEVDKLNAALANQDKLLRLAVHERKEYMAKLEVALKEPEIAKSIVVVSDEFECDTCAIHMSNFASLQTKYATFLDEFDEIKARPTLLGACKLCSGLQSELAEKNKKIALLEMASSDSQVMVNVLFVKV